MYIRSEYHQHTSILYTIKVIDMKVINNFLPVPEQQRNMTLSKTYHSVKYTKYTFLCSSWQFPGKLLDKLFENEFIIKALTR